MKGGLVRGPSEDELLKNARIGGCSEDGEGMKMHDRGRRRGLATK